MTTTGIGAYSSVEVTGPSAVCSTAVAFDAIIHPVSSPTINSTFGIRSVAKGGSTSNYGGSFNATVATAGTNYGVYAAAANGTTENWAGYFAGKVKITGDGFVNGTVQIASDATLKTNIQDLGNGSTLLEQLNPKTYEFIPGAMFGTDLPTGTQAGFLAQEVEDILPWLVKDELIPEVIDSTGTVVTPSQTIKTLNYIGLIPYLVAAYNEQTQRADQQEDRLMQLEQQLAACCTATDIDATPRSMQDGSGTLENELLKADIRLTIAPNPFQEQTTISYTLEGNSRVQLQVSNQGGLHIATLRDQQQEEGAYSLTWHTADLAPGTYIVTLFADGAPVVKRAVKVR